MTLTDARVEPLDPATASEVDCAALLDFSNCLRFEVTPDDPPATLESALTSWRNIPSTMSVSMWVAWSADREQIVARAQVTCLNREDNRQLAQVAIQVRPEHRRRRLGRRLLAPVAARMRESGRTLLMGETFARMPGGAAFMERLGAKRGMETHVHQLEIAALDLDRMREWQRRAGERAAGFELAVWEGPYPEADLPAICDLIQVMNTQPVGDLRIEKQTVTPEQLKEVDRVLAIRGTRRWTVIVREKATGRFAGFTDAYWAPRTPDILQQGNTGVFPQFRGLGLGRWLKAAMIDRVLSDGPSVKFVRTSNADSNDAMLKINREMGFEAYLSRTVWQAEIEAVEKYLAGRV
jgi:mycothiol synthase